ncbi:homeobox-leucine zipper protein ATHB-40 [Tanacetum coccineum]
METQVDDQMPPLGTSSNQPMLQQLGEQSFLENSHLEEETKTTLASELGLERRRVAVWFQNRRARFNHEKEVSDLKNEIVRLKNDNFCLETEVSSLKEQLLINRRVEDGISATRNFLANFG